MEDLIRRSDAVAILEDLQKDHLQFCLIPFRQAIERVQAIPSAESTGDLDNAIYEYVQDGLMSNPYDRPQGEWIETDMRCYGATVYKCSVCGDDVDEMPTVMGVPKYKFCPYCGAMMKGADDES